MTVFKRGNRWVAQVHDSTTKRAKQVGTFATKREAVTAEREAIRDKLTHSITVREWADRWLTEFPKGKPGTELTHKQRLSSFVAEYGHRRMDSITVLEARAWALEHKHALPGPRAMWNDARRAGLLLHNPFERLGIEQSRGRRDLKAGWLTTGDVDHIADSTRVLGRYGDIFRAAVIFAAYTGVRPGELYTLEHGDLRHDEVDIERGADSHSRTVGTPKNSYARTIVYPRAAREAVGAMPKLAGTDLVFPTPTGRQFWASTFGRYWDKVKNAAGRPDMDFYEFRHHCATHLLERGVSAADVAVQLGHTDGGALVLSTYGHPSEVAARARVRTALDGYESGDVASIRERRGA